MAIRRSPYHCLTNSCDESCRETSGGPTEMKYKGEPIVSNALSPRKARVESDLSRLELRCERFHEVGD
jgi:hypothetical protein